jgi:hypothetical protein
LPWLCADCAGMTLATTAAPFSSERRDMFVSGTRAVVSSQQLMGASKFRREMHSKPWYPRLDTPDPLLFVACGRRRNAHARIMFLAGRQRAVLPERYAPVN